MPNTKSNKIISVIENNERLNINFSNYTNFTQISEYLLKNFGKGRYIYEVDLETGEEIIKYTLN